MTSLSSYRRVLPLLRNHHHDSVVVVASDYYYLFMMERCSNSSGKNENYNNNNGIGSQRRLFSNNSQSNNDGSTTTTTTTTKKKSDDWLSSTLSSDTAKSYFQSLRLRVASALTSSLSPEDRDTLLQPYYLQQQQKVERKNEPPQGLVGDEALSIGEAIATAVAQEARRNDVQWQKKKDEIHRQAEQAAAERVQNDVLLLEHRKQKLSQWAKNLHKEITTTAAPQPTLTKPNTITDSTDNHPILGKVHVDLGYKQIYVVPATKLAAIPIWEKQRVYRHDRAKVMASDKMKTMHLGLPGVITLHETNDGNLSILDGQHRVGMMAILEQKRQQRKSNSDDTLSDELNLDQVLVEVFASTKNEHDTSNMEDERNDSTLWAQELFTEINKAEPVKLVDMPGIAKATERRIINIASTQLQESYPDMFKPSQRCRPPHLNIDNLRDAIFASNILSKPINVNNSSNSDDDSKNKPITSSKLLLEYMLQQNDILATKYENIENDNDDSISVNVSKNAIVKAKRFGFYLGLESSWLYK